MSTCEPHFLDVTGCVNEVPISGPHRLVRLVRLVQAALQPAVDLEQREAMAASFDEMRRLGWRLPTPPWVC